MSLKSMFISYETKGLFPLVGRLLISVLFVTAGYAKITDWSGNLDYMRSKGLANPTLVALLLGAALIIENVGALCLITGFQARIAAFIMFLYLTVVTIMMHNFWAYQGIQRAGTLMQFEKNLGMLGGLLMIAAFGPGRYALGRSR